MFDDRLKNLRIKKGLNMRQVAKDLDLSYTTYVGYEKNEREPNSEVLVMIADYFSCSVDYLIGRKTKPDIKLEKDKGNEKFDVRKQQIIKNFELMNEQGKEMLLDYSEFLIGNEKYIEIEQKEKHA